MYCPKCSITLCLCPSCKSVDDSLNSNTDIELFICKGCKLTRPLAWWESLQFDVEIEIKWPEKEVIEEEAPEELAGYCESPWGD